MVYLENILKLRLVFRKRKQMHISVSKQVPIHLEKFSYLNLVYIKFLRPELIAYKFSR
jgi:hypothetical protein